LRNSTALDTLKLRSAGALANRALYSGRLRPPLVVIAASVRGGKTSKSYRH
jgi:hypothetical protein